MTARPSRNKRLPRSKVSIWRLLPAPPNRAPAARVHHKNSDLWSRIPALRATLATPWGHHGGVVLLVMPQPSPAAAAPPTAKSCEPHPAQVAPSSLTSSRTPASPSHLFSPMIMATSLAKPSAIASAMPEEAPVTMVALSCSRMIYLLTFVAVSQHHVQEQRRRPREQYRAMPLAGDGIEVLVETLPPAQIHDGPCEALRMLFVAVVPKTAHQKPVYVDPDRSPPVLHRGEPETAHIVAGHGRYALA